MTTNDPLTGLYDRATLFAQLDGMIHDAVEHSAPLAVLIIDINRFRKINRNYGYLAGDCVLQGVAVALKTICRSGDVIARIGDDQFAFLLSRVANVGHAQLAALKIQRLLHVPIEADKRQIRCTTTIGIALFSEQTQTTESLLKLATRTLDDAKRIDQSIGLPNVEDKDEISNHRDIELSLGDSIHNSELEVYFQPKISLVTGIPTGAEALVRWNNPMRGLMSPGEFLPVAESIGFLKQLSVWMLNSALRYSGTWTDKWGRLGVSVNIPPSMMANPDFVDLILSAENLWEHKNSYLCVEVLEEALIEDVDLVFERLCELRDKDILVSVDDFGTGYSSLSYFRDIPADELKIDRSFVFNLTSDLVNQKIVSLIIEMAHLFGMKVVAEGVEDKEAIAFLKAKECDSIQGFYIAKPMPAAEFKSWLERYTPDEKLFAKS